MESGVYLYSTLNPSGVVCAGVLVTIERTNMSLVSRVKGNECLNLILR